MAVPPFEEYYLPALEELGKKEELSLKQWRMLLQHRFELTEDDLLESTRGGKDFKHYNRTRFSALHLTHAGLAERRARGIYIVTIAGKKLLGEGKSSLTRKDLEEYPRFVAAMSRRKKGANSLNQEDSLDQNEDSEERLEPIEELKEIYNQINNDLASEVLVEVRGIKPKFFEKLVVDLLKKMGYGGEFQNKGRVAGGPGDRGIDGVIDQDAFGLDKVYIQAKHQQRKVSDEAVVNFIGALDQINASKGVFFTTSSFSISAKESAERSSKSITLVDGDKLAKLMIKHRLGVSEEEVFSLCKLDNDYFDELGESNDDTAYFFPKA